ncbi:MAG: hypothetical protein DLM61_23585 [Pseudonocardiales bacterium]|nr:MAG: hypothetical protein DLM61_23585 [Pseudonocardiales bacterium]
MSSPVIGELRRFEAAFERAEQARMEAAEAEHGAFVRWQEAYGAYEVARDEASAAWTAWVEAIVP